jgi:hypothetical protein
MAAYKVFYKDYANRKGVFLGVLPGAGKGLNDESPLELVLKSARLVYADKVKDKKDIFIVPQKGA